jgi:hypothetical protein
VAAQDLFYLFVVYLIILSAALKKASHDGMISENEWKGIWKDAVMA